MPSNTSKQSPLNSGPRWLIVGRSIARRIRSGTLVGPVSVKNDVRFVIAASNAFKFCR